MIRRVSKVALEAGLRQVARLGLTRHAMRAVSETTRGPSIAFLRLRRILPGNARGRAHADHHGGLSLTPRQLERTLARIQRTLPFIHLGEAVERLASGRRLDQSYAVLTLDESFAASVELGLPVCRKLGVPVTMFVTTGHLEGQSTLWDSQVTAALERIAPEPLRVPFIDRVLLTDTPKRRAHAAHALLLHLTTLPESRLEERLDALWQRTGGVPPLPPLDRMLTAGELARLSNDALLSFGAHGHAHLPLKSMSDDVVMRELREPRHILKDLVGPGYVDVASFPFGVRSLVDDRAPELAREAGYRAAFTAIRGVARPGDHLFRLPRLLVTQGTGAIEAHALSGVNEALDELLLVATGAEARLMQDLEG